MLWVFLEEQHLCGLTVIVRSCFIRGHLVLFATSPLSLLNWSCLHLLLCLDVVPLGGQSSSVAICHHDSSYFTGLSPAPWCFLDIPPSRPVQPLCFLLTPQPSGVGGAASHTCKQTLQFWAPHPLCIVPLTLTSWPCVPCVAELILLCKCKVSFISLHLLLFFLCHVLSLTCFIWRQIIC